MHQNENDDTVRPLSIRRSPSLALAIILPAAAGAMAWGIRGQYGHETGAMIAGLLVGLTLVLLFCPRITPLNAARAVALMAIGVSFGGAMTYGQTVGLTHDAEVNGNHGALAWGFFGLAVKGAAWIGFAGAFLGIGLSGKSYRSLECALLLLVLIALLFLGIYILNEPFDPANRELPSLYFSDEWHWEPQNPNVSPRSETWGGYWFALLGLIAYFGFIKKDRLARNMAVAGVVAGAIGFPAGQSLQAFHAWNPDLFTASAFKHVNWWNMMETTFGTVLGAGLGLGLWLNRRHIAAGDVDGSVELAPSTEWLLIAIHAAAISVWNFGSFDRFDHVADLSLTMGLLPVIGIVGGRYWPWMLSFPLLALPIAGKTLRQMAYRTDEFSMSAGWIFLFVLPMAVMLLVSAYFIVRARRGQSGRNMARIGLVIAAWFYFSLNHVFFGFPAPWKELTGRAPNAAIFFLCAVVLTTASVFLRGPDAEPSTQQDRE